MFPAARRGVLRLSTAALRQPRTLTLAQTVPHLQHHGPLFQHHRVRPTSSVAGRDTPDALPASSIEGALPALSATDALAASSATDALPSSADEALPASADEAPSPSAIDALPASTDEAPSPPASEALPASTDEVLPASSATEALPASSATGAPSVSTAAKKPRRKHITKLPRTLNEVTSNLVSTTSNVAAIVDVLHSLPKDKDPALFIDVEGANLSRNGLVSLVGIYVLPKKHVYFIDVHALGEAAFTTPASSDPSVTLKTILESPAITKVFFDVRADSDALFNLHGISLAGVEDVQLMENARRPKHARRLLSGLNRCISTDAPIEPSDLAAWKEAKEKGMSMFRPEEGGSYEVFNHRPLAPAILEYCVNDIIFLPMLRGEYFRSLHEKWKRKTAKEAARRVALSQSPDFVTNNPQNKFGPWPETQTEPQRGASDKNAPKRKRNWGPDTRTYRFKPLKYFGSELDSP